MTTAIDAEEAFLACAGDLTIHDLWDADDPNACLEGLGYTIVWSRPVSVQPALMTDYLLQDSDDRWYAIRLGDYFGADGVIRDWQQKPFRLLLLYEALSKPLAGPEPVLGELTQSLAADERAVFNVHYGDQRAHPFLLAAALHKLGDEDFAAHETLIALTHPDVLPSLQRMLNWVMNTIDPAGRVRAVEHLAHATHRMWPTLARKSPPDWVPEGLMRKLLTYPPAQWPLAAEDLLEEAAFTVDSLTFDMLSTLWAGSPREVDQFTPDLLRTLTTPAGVKPRKPRTGA